MKNCSACSWREGTGSCEISDDPKLNEDKNCPFWHDKSLISQKTEKKG